MDDFEDDWELLRGVSKTSSILVDPTDTDFRLESLLQRTIFEATQVCNKYVLSESRLPSIEEVVRDCTRIFIGIWKRDFREPLEQLALVESVLDNLHYTALEANMFLQALPRAVVTRLVSSTKDTANGTVGILAVELKRRDGLLGVRPGRSDEGHFYLTFDDPVRGTITVYTSDSFQL